MRSNFSCFVLFVLSTCACCCCCSCHRVCVSKLDVLHSKCLVLQSRVMHVWDRAPAGSLLQLKAAAKACRMGLQGGSLNYRSRLHRGPAARLGTGCTSRPSITSSYARGGICTENVRFWAVLLLFKQLETFVILPHFDSFWVCRMSHMNSGVRDWDWDSDRPEIWWSGPVRSCIQSGWTRHASVMQCQVFIKSPVGNLKYEWELFYAYQQIYYSRS